MDHRVACSLVDGHTLAGQDSVCPPPTVSSNRQKPRNSRLAKKRGAKQNYTTASKFPTTAFAKFINMGRNIADFWGPVGLISGLSARALSTLDTTDILLLQVLLYLLVGRMNLPTKRAGA